MAVKRKFRKEFLITILDKDDKNVIVSNHMVSKRRWSITNELIFKHEDKFYWTTYSYGATEYQEERPFEYEGDEIECVEVAPVEVSVIKYQPV